jgi:hypothetical protein
MCGGQGELYETSSNTEPLSKPEVYKELILFVSSLAVVQS